MVGRRMVAAVIDLILIVAPLALLFLALSSTAPAGSVEPTAVFFQLTLGQTEHYISGSTGTTFLLVCLAWWLFAMSILPTLTGGSTFGMALLHLRVVRMDGSSPSVLRHLARTLLWVVDGFPYFIPGAIGLLCIAVTPTNQRVGDVAAQTIVVPERGPRARRMR
jgi:uncharacterized RDD family membrane protein YckC